MVGEFVHHRTSLEEVADHLRGCEVVVHRIIALLAQTLHHLLRLSVALVRYLHTSQVSDTVHQFLQSLLSSLQGLVREIHRATIVGREDKETDGHGRIGLL